MTTPLAATRPSVHAVLPGAVDDPARPSGGNTYDRRAAAALAAAGWQVCVAAVPGGWPDPDRAALDGLAAALGVVPDGAWVLVDGLVGCAAPGVLAAVAGRVRVALLVHLPLADETGTDPGRAADRDARERAALHAAAVVIATSTATAAALIARHGLDPRRVRVAAPGVDPAPPAPGSATGTRLLCVASVTPRKGHDVLVEALGRLAVPQWECVCVGPGEADPGFAVTVRARAAALGLPPRLRFVGPLTGADLAARYAAADLLVLPSRAEPYGMVVTEALARAVPVLASDVDGLPEALGRAPDGTVPGVLVPPGDPAALAAALDRWLTDPALGRRLRAAAAARRPLLRGWDATAADLATALAGAR